MLAMRFPTILTGDFFFTCQKQKNRTNKMLFYVCRCKRFLEATISDLKCYLLQESFFRHISLCLKDDKAML